MIKIDYDREKNSTLIFCGDMSFMDSLLPLKIQMKNIITGEIHYTTHLFSNMWSCWNGAELITDILIYTNDGNLLEEYKWSVLQHGDEIEKTLWFYLKNRKNLNNPSNGLIIGTHDGRNGHWIYPIKENLSKATLIDGSEKQFLSLTQNYKTFNNVEFINTIVTVNGENVNWFTGGEGYTDTVDIDLIKEWVDETEISKQEKSSISINELMSKQNYDWLHLDVEGIDDKLILCLHNRPNLIIFESMNLTQERLDILNIWFSSNGYVTKTCNGNTVAILKELK